jgi:hypothetical protein
VLKGGRFGTVAPSSPRPTPTSSTVLLSSKTESPENSGSSALYPSGPAVLVLSCRVQFPHLSGLLS